VVADTIAQAILERSTMVMSIIPTTPLAAASPVPESYARPLGQRLTGKFHRFPLVLAGIAIVSLLLPIAQADAAVVEQPASASSIAAQIGTEPALQQRDGRRGGGGGQFRGNRGGAGGGGREFRAQRNSNIGSARIENRQQFRQERRGDARDFRQERRGDVRDFRQERRGDVRDFRQDRRGDRQDLRQGNVTRPEFRAERRDDRRDFRQDRRGDVRDFRQDRRGDVRDFRADRRGDRRDFRQDRRFDNRDFRNDRRNLGFDRRGFDNRRFDNRGWGGGGNWNRGWRNDRRYDWYGFRNQNRSFFRVGRYYPPVRGWNYRRLGIGFTLGAPFFASSFWINDPWAYRLPPASGQFRWVRYYGDVLLVDVYTGQVVDVINDFFW
jgi:hypothetical protein